MTLACGGNKPKVDGNALSTQPPVQDAGAPDVDDDPPIPETKVEDRPVGNTTEAANKVIDDVMESRHTKLDKCATAYRVRKGEEHATLSVLIAFDKDGTLMGVTTRKPDQSDKGAQACIYAALHGAPFPRTHTSGMEIEKFFGYGVVYR